MNINVAEKSAARKSASESSRLSVGEALELIFLVIVAVASIGFVLRAFAGSATAGLENLL